MPLSATARPPARKRVRKRKRRAPSSASSSSSSASSSESDSETPTQFAAQRTSSIVKPATVSTTQPAPKAAKAAPSSSSSSSASSSSSSSSSVSSSEEDEIDDKNEVPDSSNTRRSPKPNTSGVSNTHALIPRPSPSPSPEPTLPPSFLPSKDEPNAQEKEAALRERFRSFWLSSVADAFADDLDVIRKEPGLTKPRLAMLVDSLASGADIFSAVRPEGGESSEMEIVLAEGPG